MHNQTDQGLQTVSTSSPYPHEQLAFSSIMDWRARFRNMMTTLPEPARNFMTTELEGEPYDNEDRSAQQGTPSNFRSLVACKEHF